MIDFITCLLFFTFPHSPPPPSPPPTFLGLYQANMAGFSRTWNRDINAAINIGKIFRARCSPTGQVPRRMLCALPPSPLSSPQSPPPPLYVDMSLGACFVALLLLFIIICVVTSWICGGSQAQGQAHSCSQVPAEFLRTTPADAVPSCTYHTGYTTPSMAQVFPQGLGGPRVNPRIRAPAGAAGAGAGAGVGAAAAAAAAGLTLE